MNSNSRRSTLLGRITELAEDHLPRLGLQGTRNVYGDLLTDVYLETRRGLELASQGGARVKVKEVELIDVSAKPAGGGGFAVRTTWRAAGSVGHWGHLHQRANRYMADLTIEPVEGRWKLTGLEILEEEQI